MRRLVLCCCLLATLALSHAAEPTALARSTQLIVVTTSSWDVVSGRLQRYQRSAPGRDWQPIGDPITIVVGTNGLGWGIGAVPLTSAHAADDPTKREGDRKAPAGIFRFGTSFGYASHAPANWKMPYLALTPSIECVDDSHSRYYNRIVDRAPLSPLSPDWTSSEHMRSAGQSYVWGIVIDHNADSPRAQAGSCVFMHIWAGPGIGTVGCTAMPQDQLTLILAWLRPEAHPLLLQMPLRSYQQIQNSLHLPALRAPEK